MSLTVDATGMFRTIRRSAGVGRVDRVPSALTSVVCAVRVFLTLTDTLLLLPLCDVRTVDTDFFTTMSSFPLTTDSTGSHWEGAFDADNSDCEKLDGDVVVSSASSGFRGLLKAHELFD